jgi:hypothetical protein
MGRTTKIKVALIAWIWLVTAVDVWCCQFLTPAYELNPLARLIIIHGGLWTLVAAKVFGTFLATEILRNLALFYTVVIALGEAALILVLAS